jgi:signal transduction histidine kinase
VRLALERGRAKAETFEELQTVADRAIGGLDQALTIITTLLRIAEIEYDGRLGGLETVALADLVREVGDLYEPIAEDKHIALRVVSVDDATVRGDRDLLLEAVANLVGNAVKFTPAGGHVELALPPSSARAALAIRLHASFGRAHRRSIRRGNLIRAHALH